MIKTKQTKQQNTKIFYVTHFAEEIRIITEAIFCLVPNIYSSLEQANIYFENMYHLVRF
jgi:ABC-type molybdenum transport system ATPase subunit/photorepair protein PhrA